MNKQTIALLCSTAPVFAVAHPVTLDIGSDVAASLPKDIVWMPAGKHTISAGTLSGGTWQGTVICDERAFAAVESSFRELSKRGPIPLDFNHNDEAASAWVKGFSWDASRGIVASVEWTGSGERALRDREYCSFSPAFLCDQDTGRVRGLVSGHAAGGIVNFPAFGAAMPALIAARLSGTEQLNPAQGGNSAPIKNNMKDKIIAMLAALGVQHDPAHTEEQLLEVLSKHNIAVAAKAKADEQLAIAAKNKSEVETIVAAAVSEGRISADQKDKWVAVGCSSRANLDLMPAKKEAQSVEADAVVASQKKSAVSATAGFVEVVRAMSKVPESDHRRRGEIYRDAREVIAKRQADVMQILAANSLGSLSGDLIVLRALDMLKFSFPALSAVSTSFSDEEARQGQVVKGRIITPPSIVTLDDATGWSDSDAVATDVPITIGQPKGVQISFTSSESAKTNRDLFGEQVDAMYYTLGKDLFDALYAVITVGNFANATAKAPASFARADVTTMAKALTGRGVSPFRRKLFLNLDYFEKLGQDSSIVNLATNGGRSEIITENDIMRVAKFDVMEIANLPTTGNLTGFGFTPDALIVATRVPEDYTRSAAPGSSHGSVSVVTNPDVGISVQKTDFVDHKGAKAYSRIAWAYGVAKGNGSSGQRLISA